MTQAPCFRTATERVSDLVSLAKPRLGLLVLFAAAAGFGMGSGPHVDWGRLGFALLGTGLVSAGAAGLNQWLERRWDRLMTRTRKRPLPSGRVPGFAALVFGAGMSILGLACLIWNTTGLAAWFAAATLLIYLALYTPMKRVSSSCTFIGAIAGAMPPVIGWAAADGSFTWQAGVLFGVLFTWQVPHLFSIAWLHREDYANAGFALLPARDIHGRAIASKAFVFSGLLTGMTMIAVRTGPAICLVGAWLLNTALILFAGRFFLRRNRETARRLFLYSIFYLPALLSLMLWARRSPFMDGRFWFR